MNDSTNHGGKRKNAGRPKGEVTRMVRVPLGCLERVKFTISAYKLGDSSLVSNEQKMKVLAEDKVRARKEKRSNVNPQNPDLEMNEITNKVNETKSKSHNISRSLSKQKEVNKDNAQSDELLDITKVKTVSQNDYDNLDRTNRRIADKRIKKRKLYIIKK